MPEHPPASHAASPAPGEARLWRRFGALPWWRLVLAGVLIIGALIAASVPYNTFKLMQPPASAEARTAVGLALKLTALERAHSVAARLDLETNEGPLVDVLRREVERTQREMREQALLEELFDQGELALLEAQRNDLEREVDRLRELLDAAVSNERPAPAKALEAEQKAAARLASTLGRLRALQRRIEGVSSEVRPDEPRPEHGQADGAKVRIELGTRALETATAQTAVPSVRGLTVVPLTGNVTVEVSPYAESMANNLRRRLAPTLQTGRGEMSPAAVRTVVEQDFTKLIFGSLAVVLMLLFWIFAMVIRAFAGRAAQGEQRAVIAESIAQTQSHARQIAEARLMVMRAQVEPHFLFNTLAHVQALQEVDPPQAGNMMTRLIAYLRAAMPGMREATSTVGRELEVVRAYLDLLKIRMGDRLAFEIDAPENLLSIPLPPTMIVTLVENAIKHGLEPRREGGRISVVVREASEHDGDKRRIEITVADDGLGLAADSGTQGSGIGLANTRERLRMLYGDAASLVVEPNLPSGVRAVLRVPEDVPETEHADTPEAAANEDDISSYTIRTTVLLAVVGGVFGIHRLYVGRYRTGVAQAVLGGLTIVSGGVPIFLIPLVMWLALDIAWLLTREFHDREHRRLARMTHDEAVPAERRLFKRSARRNPLASPCSRALTVVFAVLLGLFGAHRFYIGRTRSAFVMLFTLGGLGLWWLIDILRALLGDLTDAQGRRVNEWE